MLRGEGAETCVAQWLEARGWTILERRLRVGRNEIDLLARLGDVVAVVEVRGRRVGGWITPLDSVDLSKQRRLAAAARALWSSRFAADSSVRVLRIDVAGVTWGVGDEPTIEVVEGAVDAAMT